MKDNMGQIRLWSSGAEFTYVSQPWDTTREKYDKIDANKAEDSLQTCRQRTLYGELLADTIAANFRIETELLKCPVKGVRTEKFIKYEQIL